MRNPFKRLSNSEKRIVMLEAKLERLGRLSIALAKIQNVHPQLLTEYANDNEKISKYVLEMLNGKNK